MQRNAIQTQEEGNFVMCYHVLKDLRAFVKPPKPVTEGQRLCYCTSVPAAVRPAGTGSGVVGTRRGAGRAGSADQRAQSLSGARAVPELCLRPSLAVLPHMLSPAWFFIIIFKKLVRAVMGTLSAGLARAGAGVGGLGPSAPGVSCGRHTQGRPLGPGLILPKKPCRIKVLYELFSFPIQKHLGPYMAGPN